MNYAGEPMRLKHLILLQVTRAADRLGRFFYKRKLALYKWRAKHAREPKRVTIDQMQFDLHLDERTDLMIDATLSLPGGKDRRIIMKEVSPGDVVFDIGANVGYYAVPFALSIGPNGRLFAFEPNPRIAERLSAHLELNGLMNVTVVPTALGSQNTEMELFVPPNDDPGSATLIQDWRKETAVEKHKVSVIRLDDYVVDQDIDRVDLIKLDVEGFELDVLSGAEHILRHHRPRVMVEAWGDSLAGSNRTIDDLMCHIKSFKYDLYKTVIGTDRLVQIVPGISYGELFEVHCIPTQQDWESRPAPGRAS